jgi:hypothetical protein
MARIYLSPPDVGDEERRLLLDAFDSNWIAPTGPHLDAFEREMAERVGVQSAVALASGTAALHLALLLLGVGPGDEILVPTLTFVATANVVTYVGARPVLVDCDAATWTVDPDLVADELERRARTNRLPRAVVTVDLYGQSADYDRLVAVCDRYGVALLEDAAEALGATYGERAAGSFGVAGVFSFNVLAEDQEELCRGFAASGTDKFAGVGWSPGPFTGAPVLAGVLAWAECRIEHLYDGGDHSIAVGRVLDLQSHEGRPLLFYRGGFGRFEV